MSGTFSQLIMGVVVLALLVSCPGPNDGPVELETVSGLSPADGASTTDTTPTFSWNAVPDAAGYELQLADSQAGVEAAPIQSVTDTSYTSPSALANEQTHYWRVRAVDGNDQKGDWSEIHSLAVSIDAVSGLSPADGASTTDTTPTFSWTEVPGAAEYEVRIADSEPGLTSASSVRETVTTHTPASALTNLQTYYWQVRAKDGAGQYGAWSDVQSLDVEWGAISGQSPADGSATPDTTPTFSWTAIPGAAGYDLQLADSRAGVESAPVQNVTDTSYTPSSALTDKHTHYWRVQAKDGAGQSGPWSVIIAIQIGYSIGDTGPAGGIVFYDKGSYSDGWRYMEAAPSDQSAGIMWGVAGITVGGTGTDIGSGKGNTEKIVNQLGSGNYAAQLCSDFELGDYDDWFLPSKDELNELYTQKDTVGGFAPVSYWSSSEDSSDYAWGQYFGNGGQTSSGRNVDKYVRAVRAF